MKILHIAEPFATGVLSFLVDITENQAQNHEVYIAWGMRPLTPQNVENLFDKRIHLIFVPEFKDAIGTVINPKAYSKVRHIYEEIKPDIVHLHSSASGFVGRWALPCNEVNTFYTPHGYSFLMQGGLPLKKLIFWTIEWLSARRKAVTVACSQGEFKEALKLSSNCTYVNNGIRTRNIEQYVSFQGQKPVVCTSGRILKQKNPVMFNRIAELLHDVHFIWIGEGELRTELTSPNIEITGWIAREKALEIISNSGFFILPSLWEGLPLSLLEGMFLKKVCLASNVIGNKDVMRTGENGFICNTAEEFADTIKRCLRGEEPLEQLAEAAHMDVMEYYNSELMAVQYDKIYNQNSSSLI